MQKTLYILRHAKAETGAPTQDDFDRNLVPRGIEAAQTIGNYMVKKRYRPQLVYCSSAVRTSQTLLALQASFTPSLEQEHLDKLYNASANEMISLISAAPDNAASLLVIGHNPGIHQLCLKLAKSGNADLLDTLAIKFPTASLCVVNFATASWRNIAVTSGQLLDFVTPSMLGGHDD